MHPGDNRPGMRLTAPRKALTFLAAFADANLAPVIAATGTTRAGTLLRAASPLRERRAKADEMAIFSLGSRLRFEFPR
jgi:hypothetical protein